MRNIAFILFATLALAGCANSYKRVVGWPSDHFKNQDFKPYVAKQEETIPAIKAGKPWVYLDGTDANAVAEQLAKSDIIYGVKSNKKKGTHLMVGPNFYNLSPSEQRHVVDLSNRMYDFSARSVFLVDQVTQKAVGTFANGQLYLY